MKLIFFDSYGEKPAYRIKKFMRRVAKWMKKNNINVKAGYNKTRHQYGDSECGVYSMNYIVRMLKGETIDQIAGEKLSDEDVNRCRKVYFR